VEGWLLALIIYADVKALKKRFPGQRDLVRSHVDYVLMGALLFGSYLLIKHMALDLPPTAIGALVLGAVYNPFGFLIKAVNPDLAMAKSKAGQVGILLGFIPATYGFGYLCIKIMLALHVLG